MAILPLPGAVVVYMWTLASPSWGYLYLYHYISSCLVVQPVTRSPPIRVALVTPCGFLDGQNKVRVGFSRDCSRFPLTQISINHFSTLISFISLQFISTCDGATGVVSLHPCYSLAFIGASMRLISRPGPMSDTVQKCF